LERSRTKAYHRTNSFANFPFRFRFEQWNEQSLLKGKFMIRQLQRLITASAIVVALQTTIAMGQPISRSLVQVPPTPAEIQVPSGNTAFLKGHAMGTQNYICQVSESGFFWKFIGPQATLFVTLQWGGTEILQQITTHFLSPNPVESGVARATWQSSIDTSAAWAKAIASSTDARYVAPGAIPWLLLQVVGTRLGPSGGSLLTPTTYIQRLNTSGGVMPATGCSDASQVGSTVFVPYSADYYFYTAGN
jgi:uncharacterized protein DUF3455